jgi:two-component system sensor histidine kinase MprB
VSLRSRISAVAAYLADRSELRGQIDKSLTAVAQRFETVRQGPPPGGDRRSQEEPGDARPPAAPPAPFGGASGYVQFIRSDGRVLRPPDETRALPADRRALEVARTGHGRFFADETVDGNHLRVLTTTDADGGAIQVARPLTEVDHALHRLLLILVIVGVVGIAIAALLGALVARAALGPVARFTSRTETYRSGST